MEGQWGEGGQWHRVELGSGWGGPQPSCGLLCLYETLIAALLYGQARPTLAWGRGS